MIDVEPISGIRAEKEVCILLDDYIALNHAARICSTIHRFLTNSKESFVSKESLLLILGDVSFMEETNHD